ncbi:TetR/AcrR family transcriptional regulator C-terminal domain-containing protein [Phycicoccus ginsengisoli]
MPRGGRESLTRARVLRAAVALADSEGLDAVTMRRLADVLDVVPMALYKHVADKDDLLAGMVDVLVEDMAAPPPASPRRWRDGVRAALHAARRVVVAHPWAQRAIESRTVRTPAVLGHMERVSGVFLAAGFTPDQTHHVMHLLGNRIWGFSPELFTGAPDAGAASAPARRSRAPEPDPADYPAIVAIATDARARRPDATGCDEDFEFDFALDVLLAGIERLRRAHWSSPS